MTMAIELIPLLEDNYAYFLEDTAGQTAIIDPSESAPILELLEQKKKKLDFILNTHHHWDHTNGNLEIKKATGCTIVGPASDKDRIPGIDHTLGDGESFNWKGSPATAIHVPGHTTGHTAFYFSQSKALFCGDTLFTLGCGFLFEGTPQQMWHSLDRLRKLPADTKVYCGHEYTVKNARFAEYIDPENAKLKKYVKRAQKQANAGLPTVPTTLQDECEANPFLRADTTEIQQRLNMLGSNPVDVFTKIRKLKNDFQ